RRRVAELARELVLRVDERVVGLLRARVAAHAHPRPGPGMAGGGRDRVGDRIAEERRRQDQENRNRPPLTHDEMPEPGGRSLAQRVLHAMRGSTILRRWYSAARKPCRVQNGGPDGLPVR